MHRRIQMTEEETWPEAEVDLEGGGHSWWYVCEECHGEVNPGQKVCLTCKRRLNWEGTAWKDSSRVHSADKTSSR